MADTNKNGLSIDVEDRIAFVTIDRPERLNALSSGLISDLVAAFDRFSVDDDVWAVLITGSGTRAFSAGIDLKEMASADKEDRLPTLPMGGTQRNVFEAVLECTKPVVAALNGVAVGGGCEVALACDVRIAADHARIGSGLHGLRHRGSALLGLVRRPCCHAPRPRRGPKRLPQLRRLRLRPSTNASAHRFASAARAPSEHSSACSKIVYARAYCSRSGRARIAVAIGKALS